MFSEYASKFLAQSGSTLSMGFGDRNPLSRNQNARNPPPSASRYQTSRSFLSRQGTSNPYQLAPPRFTFGSRTSAAPAPLFHSTLDDFREEDDDEEHARDVAEHYALQRSRRQMGASRLTESSGSEDASSRLEEEGPNESTSVERPRGRGIRSSWTGEPMPREKERRRFDDYPRGQRDSKHPPEISKFETAGKQSLVDVALNRSQIGDHSDLGSIQELAYADDHEPEKAEWDPPPPVQQAWQGRSHTGQQQSRPTDSIDGESILNDSRSISPDRESVPLDVELVEPTKQFHDLFLARIYMLLMAAFLGSVLLSFMETSSPDGRHPLGDSIYSAIQASLHLLGVDTLTMVILSILFMIVLRSAMRPLVYTTIVAVPIVLTSFSIYPFVASFQGHYQETRLQDRFMRLVAFIPAALSVVWIFITWKSRTFLSRAIDILEFSARILDFSPGLILLGFASLLAQVTWIWLWLLMFQRIFLKGHFKSGATNLFLVDAGTWALGAFFILMYLWTQAIISGIQRATTAAVVSQWYFHRNAGPGVSPTSRAVVQESFRHATSIIFGTICASTCCQLLVRLPLLLAPRRLIVPLTACIYNFIPTPVASLANPLTLSYAAIHSQPLVVAARGLGNMAFISITSPTTTLSPSHASDHSAPLLPYRLAKLIIHATRYVIALAIGIAGWVSISHNVRIGDSGAHGSLYAYIVGMAAAAIGWSIFGAMEGVLGFVVDAVAVCWGTECAARQSKHGRFDSRGGYCYEAAELFGGF